MQMCIIQHAQMKSVFTFEATIVPVFTLWKVQSLLPRAEFSFQGP